MNYNVMITGWGTRKQLVESLRDLVKGIETSEEQYITDTWEDPTLCATISEHYDMEFKIGEVVKITNNKYNSLARIGEKVTILDPESCDCGKTDGEEWPYLVRYENGDEMWMNDEDLDHI